MKERYSIKKDSWGNFSAEYYQLLNTNDRLIEIILSRYKSIFEAEKALGYKRGTLYSRFYERCCTANLKGLNRLLKALNVSFQYAVFGTGDPEYKIKDLTFKNLYDTYMSAYVNRKNPKVTAAICNAYHKKARAVPLKYLIRIARKQRKSIDYLLEG